MRLIKTWHKQARCFPLLVFDRNQNQAACRRRRSGPILWPVCQPGAYSIRIQVAFADLEQHPDKIADHVFQKTRASDTENQSSGLRGAGLNGR